MGVENPGILRRVGLDHGRGLRLFWLGATTLLEGWAERRRQRRALLALSDHQLKDLGISRREAEREGSKPFWQR